jgi:hypothetical protein
VKAVYGSGFNGHMYLKRFFDFDYQLPAPSNEAFAKVLFTNSWISERRICSGVPQTGKHIEEPFVSPEQSFHYIAELLELDLRSQQQVFLKLESSIAVIPQTHEIQILYLTALLAIHHVSPQAFNKCLFDNSLTGAIKHLIKEDRKISYNYHDQNGRLDNASTSISQILDTYHSIHRKRFSEVANDTKFFITNSLPDHLVARLCNFSNGSQAVQSLKFYIELIRLADHLSN